MVKQVEPLRKLFDARQRLNDLLAKLDGNDKLDALLRERRRKHRQPEDSAGADRRRRRSGAGLIPEG